MTAPESSARPTRRSLLLLCAATLAAVILYLPTTRNGLVWDDVELVRAGADGPVRAFGRGFWQDGATRVLGQDTYYRPLANATIAGDRALGNGRPWFFHATNVLLHAAVVLLFGLLALGLTHSATTAALAAGAFGLHPLLADSVAYVSGRTDLLCALGLVIALHGLVRMAVCPGSPRHLAALLGGFAIAIYSKESALVFLLLAPAWLLVSRPQRRLNRTDLTAIASLAVIALSWFAARSVVLAATPAAPGQAGIPALLLLSLRESGAALASFFLPLSGRIFRWQPAAIPWALATIGYLLLPVLLHRYPDRRAALGAWLWGAAFLLPVAPLVRFGPLGRILYIPALGLVLVATLILRRAPDRLRPTTAIACLCLLAGLVPLNLRRQQPWRDGNALFHRMIAEAPENPAGHFNLALEYRNRGWLDSAARAYATALRLDSTIVPAWSNLGAILHSQGRLDDARRLYERALALAPDYTPARANLNLIRDQQADTNRPAPGPGR